jgi:cysteine desulfurase NifS
VMLNVRDAAQRGIVEGDLVEVVTPRGRVTFRAQVGDSIMQGVVDADMGGGGPLGPEPWQKANVNDLTNIEHYDPISGFPVYKALLCDVLKVRSRNNITLEGSACGAEIETKIEAFEHQAMEFKRIYLDHNATTPVDPEVLETISTCMEKVYGNPSSIHNTGNSARAAVESSRRQVAQLLNCTARRIVFMGGGSEADNLALKGTAFAYKDRGNHIITSAIEHPAVLASCRWLEQMGFSVTYLPANRDGQVSSDDLLEAITPQTILVSIMTANNETGSIQRVREFADICRSREILFHTDAVQAVGKIPVDVQELDVDLLTLSGHKLHGPKGIGALYIRRGVRVEPLIQGGKQEYSLRAGTENVPGIAGLGKAAELAAARLPEMKRVQEFRDRLQTGIMELLPAAFVNGSYGERLPNTLNITLPGMRGESVVLALDHKGVALSSGSACRAGSPEPSHALLAMGLSENDAHCSLRFSLGLGNTAEEIDRTLMLMKEMITDLSETIQFVPCR